MNLSRFLPGFAKRSADAELADEAYEAEQAKLARIQYHRDHVRNGPVKMRHISSGRVASQDRRREAARVRKQNRDYRRDFMRSRGQLAILRGQLETVAAIKTASGTYMVGQSTPLMRNAWVGLFKVYGPVVAQAYADKYDGESVGHLSVESDDDRALVGQTALHHYELATGVAA